MAQTCNQRLTINGVAIGESVTDTPRFQIKSFADIFKREVRGDDRQIPYLSGRTPYPRRLDRCRMLFPMVIRGDRDAAGAVIAEASWAQQRITNLLVIFAAVGPGAVGADAVTGTVTATWLKPDATTAAAAVHVILPMAIEDPGTTRFFRAVLDVNVPAGRFV